jgi:Flp pilus assembly protein TadG
MWNSQRAVPARRRQAGSRARQDPRGRVTRRRAKGQALVEFALVVPLFLMVLLAMIEFAFIFNSLLTANYATRDASLIAAEAGSSEGADCVILAKLLEDMRPPVAGEDIQQIIIYRARSAGDPYNGTFANSGNVWVRSGTTDCSPYGKSATMPYTLQTANYAEGAPDMTDGTGGRCAFLAGCPNATLRPRDAVGVQVTYDYHWHTPLGNFLPFANGPFTIVRANEMRMEPIL